MVDLLVKALVDTWEVTPRVLIILVLSLYGSQVLIELGVFEKLAFIGRPLTRIARLPAQAGLTFVTSLGSVVAGNAMLARLQQEGKLDGRQTFLIGLLNSTPIQFGKASPTSFRSCSHCWESKLGACTSSRSWPQAWCECSS